MFFQKNFTIKFFKLTNINKYVINLKLVKQLSYNSIFNKIKNFKNLY